MLDCAVPEWISRDATRHEDAQLFLRDHGTLHDLIHAGGEVIDVVIQDEYTHDVIARLPASGGASLVVFDCT